jgi:hypothetical protein
MERRGYHETQQPRTSSILDVSIQNTWIPYICQDCLHMSLDACLRRIFANRFRSATYVNLKRSAALQIPIFTNITLLTTFDVVSSDRLGLGTLERVSNLQHMYWSTLPRPCDQNSPGFEIFGSKVTKSVCGEKCRLRPLGRGDTGLRYSETKR